MSVTLTVDTRAWRAAAEKLLEVMPNRLGHTMRSVARGVVKEVIALTPPKRKGAGTAAVRRDIRKLFMGAKNGRGMTESEMRSIHEAARNRRGQVTKGIRKKGFARHRVNRELLNQYIRKRADQVGFLASGWVASARRTGAAAPSWVGRHNAPGWSTLDVLPHGIYFTMANQTPYVNEIEGLDRRIQRALDIQTAKLLKQVDHMVAASARQSGL